jgi:pyridinium-3,5-bisthiocarboxylic acid mononucleotide nickel chelatase
MKETVLYYDCFSGISGDMNLAAMVGLGVPEEHLRSELAKLGLGGWKLGFVEDSRNGIHGLRADVELGFVPREGGLGIAPNRHGKGHEHRAYRDIRAMIERSALPETTKARSFAIFDRLAGAEAKVHGASPEDVEFHEVGAIDSIIDIVGAAICIEYLEPDRVIVSRVELGGGFVKCQHGTIPVPAPAVVELLRGAPVKSGAVQFETTTPTGAAILAAFADEYSDDMRFTISSSAYGVGHREMEIPNLLRVLMGERETGERDSRGVVLECNIDDMNPELHGHVLELLLASGAQDAWITPILMKKSRSAISLSALCPPEEADRLARLILSETTSFGLRRYAVDKTSLQRETRAVGTSLGEVHVKTAFMDGKALKSKLEYEDVRRIAAERGLPLLEAYAILAREVGLGGKLA